MGNTRHCIDDNKLSCFDTIKLFVCPPTSKYEGDWQSILHSHPFSELFMSCRAAVLLSQRAWNFRWERMIWWSSIPMCSTRRNQAAHSAALSILCWELRGFPFPFEEIAATQEGVYMQTAFGDVYKYNTQNSNIFAYLNILLEEINKKAENYETVCQNLLEVIMICMLRNNNLSIVQSSNALLNRECTQIKHYLDANYAENITLDMLASLSHMNKYYFNSMPSPKCIGISPITYLLQKRIQEGKSLLESTSYSISQISTTLGFSSQSYFSQAFKKATGKTPVQYRNAFKRRGEVFN